MIALSNDIQTAVLDDKASRKVLLHQNSMMLVGFTFKKDGIGQPHSHEDHEQIGYIAKGVFEVTVGDQTETLSCDDSYYQIINVVSKIVK